MTKGTITTLTLLIFSLVTGFAQQTISLKNAVDYLLTNKKVLVESKNILVTHETFSYSFDDVNLYYVDQSNFRITAYQDDFDLQLLVRNTILSGTIKNKHNNIAYSLTYDNELVFNQINKSDLIPTCSFENTHSHPPVPIQQTSSFRKKAFGNEEEVIDPLLLESRPGATHLVYIDYDGESNLQGWSYTAKDANIPNEHKTLIWKIISEDFLPFDVNITNNRTLFEKHNDLNKTWLVVADFGKQGWRGLAYRNSYGDGRAVLFNYPQPNENKDHTLLVTGSHEVGHALGLTHDGINKDGHWQEYYSGHGEYTPIMGSGSNHVAQWSRGEYPNATNGEDDISTLGKKLGFVSDDYTSATDLLIDGLSVDPSLNFGFIGDRNDTDTFMITLKDGGLIDLTVFSPLDTLTNLDVNLILLDENKTIITTSAPIGDRKGYIDELVNPGTYYLIIDGGGELTTADGFSDYGSIGYYEITGTVGYAAPICRFSISSDAVCTGDQIQITNESYGENLIYQWTFIGDETVLSSDKNPSFTITKDDAQILQLTVANTKGETTCSQNLRGGNQKIEITLPRDKVKQDFQIIIGNQSHESANLTYLDFRNMYANALIAEHCLSTDCYEVELIDIFIPETSCGIEEWVSTKVYGNIHGVDHFVMYMGNIYKAKGYTKGNIPSIDKDYPWILAESNCPITDAVSIVTIRDINTNEFLFSTTPLQVGNDLYQKEVFCFKAASSISVLTTTPTNCEDVLFETGVQVSGTNFSWDFGLGATPQTISGKGPHAVAYSTSGSKEITLTIDGQIETKNITVADVQKTPSISISTTNQTSCKGTEVSFDKLVQNGGNNPIIKWFINDDLIDEGVTFNTSTLKNNDVVKASMTSDEACLKTETAESNNIEVTVEDCVSGISNKSIEAIHIYPNPANERLFIKTTEPVKFTIFNTTGIKVLTGTYAENGIDITNLQAGFYIIQIGNNTTKLIIE